MEETNTGTEDVIEVKNLWKIFGHNPKRILEDRELCQESRELIQEKSGCLVALRDVSFTVGKGELFVIMGLSGSGKSTLIRCMPRLVEPTAGEILINGKNILEYAPPELRELRRFGMSMVFQHYGLLPHHTVLDNVAYGLIIRGSTREESYQVAEGVIEKVGLKGWENYYPSALSGGMQQRVGLARALANNPGILLMDEPFSGLDPLIRRQMQDQLIELQSELAKTILFVTHDLDEALKLGSRIALMKDGVIVQTGTPEEIVTNPESDYVRQFVRDVSPGKVLTASGIMTAPSCLLYGWMGPHTALNIMRRTKCNFAFVVGTGNRYIGLVTHRQLIDLRRDKPFVSMQDVVLPDIPATDGEVMASDLINMASSSPYPLPVLNVRGELIGEISNELLLSSLARTSFEPETKAEAEPGMAEPEEPDKELPGAEEESTDV